MWCGQHGSLRQSLPHPWRVPQPAGRAHARVAACMLARSSKRQGRLQQPFVTGFCISNSNRARNLRLAQPRSRPRCAQPPPLPRTHAQRLPAQSSHHHNSPFYPPQRALRATAPPATPPPPLAAVLSARMRPWCLRTPAAAPARPTRVTSRRMAPLLPAPRPMPWDGTSLA